jgi:YidC/Oxa1 family membrane protein insertase
MERRVLLAIFLAFLTLYVWQALFAPPPPGPEPAAPTTSAPAAKPPEAATPPPAPTAASAATPLVFEPAERDIRIETADVIATFTNVGGRLKSWHLKRYLDQNSEPLELVVTQLADTQPLPFSLRTDDSAVTATLNGAPYAVRGGDTGPGSPGVTEVAFEYRDSAGLHALKEFRIDTASPIVSVRIAVTRNDQKLEPVIEWGPGIGAAESATGQYAQSPGGIVSISDDVERIAPGDVAEQPVRQADFQYVGVEDHYFLVAALYPGVSRAVFQPVTIPPPSGSDDAARALMAFSLEPGRRDDFVRFYVGPKDFEKLASVDRSLVRAINFGVFAVIVVPLLRSLNWINGFVGNYGWSIVLLTVIINALMFPLRHKSVVSMRKMQEIQPEAKAIQERYAKLKATDPAKQKMNQELMALYRERGVNPASGCVPMLLTLPVLFAFYSLLSTAIELRGAPFFGWIKDLSQHDPLYIIPVLMSVTQVWQQRITPQAGVDPAQQKMMMIMPIVFMFILLWAPAGVVLYWFVSNLWGIGQQYLTNYLIGPPTVRQVRPAAERRVKRVGSGKTEAAAREN